MMNTCAPPPYPLHPSPLVDVTSLQTLDAGKVATVTWPNPRRLRNLKVHVKPDTGYWKGATIVFDVDVPIDSPHKAPKVLCDTPIYHPNIDTMGKVCLNILREDWKPVLDMTHVVYGVLVLFNEPNPKDPLRVYQAL